MLVDLLTLGVGVDSGLVEVCLLHQILHCKWKVCVQHIPKSINRVADHMAKLSSPSVSLMPIFQSPPMSVLGLLDKDSRGFNS